MSTKWTEQQKKKKAYIETLAQDYLLRALFGEDRFELKEEGKVVASCDRTESLDEDLAKFREIVKGSIAEKNAQFRRGTFRR
jgi:hypothetical protein